MAKEIRDLLPATVIVTIIIPRMAHHLTLEVLLQVHLKTVPRMVLAFAHESVTKRLPVHPPHPWAPTGRTSRYEKMRSEIPAGNEQYQVRMSSGQTFFEILSIYSRSRKRYHRSYCR